MLVQGFALSLIIAYMAFFLTWVTLDATLPITVIGTAILGFGGWILSIALVVFFMTSSLLSRLNRDREPAKDQHLQIENRRDGLQVWANGFWVTLFCIAWFLLPLEAILGAAFGIVATATADTWATETGLRNPGKTINIKTGEVIEPGTDGGVSFKGTFFAIVGAVIIGFFASQQFLSFPLKAFLIISAAGFIGCLIDSFIGSLYQTADHEKRSGSVWKTMDREKQNSFVNWLSTGSGGCIALILLLIF